MEKYKVIFSPEVIDRLFDVIKYLKTTWSDTVADDFSNTFFEKVQELKANPKTGRIAERNNEVRSIPITKHNRLYYHIKDEFIKLDSLLDTRQSPAKNKFE